MSPALLTRNDIEDDELAPRNAAAEFVRRAPATLLENLEPFYARGEQCGWCSHPVRLIGSSTSVDLLTGEVVGSFHSDSSPGKVVLKACGTRRATWCPSCALVYARDARMLVLAGMTGEKGLPRSVAEHPMVFATLTAPSFGRVHGTRGRSGRPCHPPTNEDRCPHGRSRSCPEVHDENDQRIGAPICPDCYDYAGTILWNATCPELWRRTMIYLRRELARVVGLSVRAFEALVRVSFVKVAEVQKRGLVHLHAVIRLDAHGDILAPSVIPVDSTALAVAVRVAAEKVTAPLVSVGDGVSREVARWGAQLDVKPIVVDHPGLGEGLAAPEGSVSTLSFRAVANYIAKYSTKSADDAGALDHRITSLADLNVYDLSSHLRRLVETAWALGASPDSSGLRRWAHSLGYGGHWLTKSRHYSVTFGHLRNERQLWRVRETFGAEAAARVVEAGAWWHVGNGWRNPWEESLARRFQTSSMRQRADMYAEARERAVSVSL